MTPTPEAGSVVELHPDTALLVERFSRALAEKLASAQRKYGYTNGWLDANWQADCIEALRAHVEKGDPRDVAAYCAFAWHHGWSTNSAAQMPPPPVSTGAVREALLNVADDYMTSEVHHPKYVLIPTSTFEQLCLASEALAACDGEDIAPPTPLGALRFRMEQGGHTQADLARLIGSRSRAAEILAGKRQLSKAQIVKLVDAWGIPARSLLGPARATPGDQS